MLAKVAFAQNTNEEAQDSDEIKEIAAQKDFTFGGEIGMNFNYFNRTGTEHGMRIGAFALYNLGEFYTLRGGLSYSQIGGQEIDRTVVSLPESAVVKRDFRNRGIRMHSIEVPIAIHFWHPDSRSQKVYPDVYVGFAYNAVMYVNERRDELWYSSETTPVGDNIKTLLVGVQDNVTANYNRHYLSPMIGTNININLSKDLSYFFGAEYKMGIQGVKSMPEPYGGNMNSSQFALKLGVILK